MFYYLYLIGIRSYNFIHEMCVFYYFISTFKELVLCIKLIKTKSTQILFNVITLLFN